MGDRDESNEPDLKMVSGGEPDTTATRLSSSDALRPGCVASAFLLAVDVVMDGSVAVTRSSRGLLLLSLRSAELLRCIRHGSDSDAIVVCRRVGVLLLMCCLSGGVSGLVAKTGNVCVRSVDGRDGLLLIRVTLANVDGLVREGREGNRRGRSDGDEAL